MKAIYRKLMREFAFRTGRGITLWQAACHPNGDEWAEWLKLHGGLHKMGKHCSIQTNVVITDPAYLSIGNNVRLSGCKLFGHDGTVNMLNRAYGLNLDKVGPIVIGDNVFIGDGAKVMPGVTIGSNVVIAAGAIVAGNVESHCVYAGIPAKQIGKIDDLVTRMARNSSSCPWAPLIQKRGSSFDPALEPELVEMRVAHFFQ